MERWAGPWESVRAGPWPICSADARRSPNFLFLVCEPMKTLQLAGLARALVASRRTWAFGAAMAVAGAAHGSGVEIQVWHTLSGPNKAEFEKLAKKYNKEQNDVVVELRDFSSAQELKPADADALTKKGQ